MTVESPRNVIRFYGKPQYALETIGFKEIIFLHADKLNDPFDPPFYFITDFNRDYQALTNYVQQHYLDDFQCFKNSFPKENWEKFILEIENEFNKNRNNSFIFSTCGIDKERHPKDSLYMWSHYGNGHRGVAIEFDTNLLKHNIFKFFGINENDQFYNIDYLTEQPKVSCETIFQFILNTINGNPISDNETELFKTFLLTLNSKSIVWKEENEWRFIWRDDETRLKIKRCPLENDTITALYLGCRIDDQIKNSLIFETKQKFPNAKIYKSKVVQGNFALEFEPLY
jgi:hypothetical protein